MDRTQMNLNDLMIKHKKKVALVKLEWNQDNDKAYDHTVKYAIQLVEDYIKILKHDFQMSGFQANSFDRYFL